MQGYARRRSTGRVPDIDSTGAGPAIASGDIVVMDKLGSHEVTGGAEAVQAAGARICYLPPYSPDYSPIEQAFCQAQKPARESGQTDR